MSVLDKVKSITNIFGNIFRRRYCYDYSQSKGVIQISKDTLIAFIEKYKGIRRLILVIVLWINIRIFLVTVYMYKLYGSVDTQWVIFAGYWSAILGSFVAFYTMARTGEFKSYTPYSRPGEWIYSQSQQPKIKMSTYCATEYTEKDDPSLYNDNIVEYTEPKEINGDILINGGINNVGSR